MSEQNTVVSGMIEDLTALFIKWRRAGISTPDIASALIQYGEGMQQALDEAKAQSDAGPLQ